MGGFCRAVRDRLRAFGLACWAHHTEIIGGIGISSGAIENYLETNDVWHLPARLKGILVGSLGLIVLLVGIYHTFSDLLAKQQASELER